MGELYKQLLQLDFYPRPPRGGRRRVLAVMQGLVPISIHALREEGDKAGEPVTIPLTDFYPRPPRGGRLRDQNVDNPAINISIHALREEGDMQTTQAQRLVNAFLSTPSARRATHKSRNRTIYT